MLQCHEARPNVLNRRVAMCHYDGVTHPPSRCGAFEGTEQRLVLSYDNSKPLLWESFKVRAKKYLTLGREPLLLYLGG